jgi:hypothetical protein
MEQTTKIVGSLSEFKENKLSIGLLNRLKTAKTAEEIDYLMSVGKTYNKVTVGTMKKWAKIAAKKKELFKS